MPYSTAITSITYRFHDVNVENVACYVSTLSFRVFKPPPRGLGAISLQMPARLWSKHARFPPEAVPATRDDRDLRVFDALAEKIGAGDMQNAVLAAPNNQCSRMI